MAIYKKKAKQINGKCAVSLFFSTSSSSLAPAGCCWTNIRWCFTKAENHIRIDDMKLVVLVSEKKQASEHDTERDRASEKEIEMIKSPLCIELIEKNREWREWANEIERTTSCRLNYDDAQLRFFIIHSINSGPDVVHTHTAHTNEM